MLPSKTIPEVRNQKHHASKHKTMKATSTTAATTTPSRKKARTSSATEVEDGQHTRHSGGNAAATISPASSFQMSYPVPAKVRNLSPNTTCFNDDHRLWGTWRRVPYTTSTKLSRTEPMEPQETMVISITIVYTALTRFARLKGQWKAILMVCFLLSAAWFF